MNTKEAQCLSGPDQIGSRRMGPLRLRHVLPRTLFVQAQGRRIRCEPMLSGAVPHNLVATRWVAAWTHTCLVYGEQSSG